MNDDTEEPSEKDEDFWSRRQPLKPLPKIDEQTTPSTKNPSPESTATPAPPVLKEEKSPTAELKPPPRAEPMWEFVRERERQAEHKSAEPKSLSPESASSSVTETAPTPPKTADEPTVPMIPATKPVAPASWNDPATSVTPRHTQISPPTGKLPQTGKTIAPQPDVATPKLVPDSRRADVNPRVTRRVSRTLRRVEAFSVLKIAVLFHFSVMLVFVMAAMLLYFAADLAGAVGNIERFVQGLGWPEWTIQPLPLFRGLLVIGIVNVIVWSALSVFVAFLYNLVSDVVGGVQTIFTEKDL